MPVISQSLGYVADLITHQTLGQKIIAYRFVRGLSQKELASEFAVDPSTLGRYERNEGNPSEKIGVKIELTARF